MFDCKCELIDLCIVCRSPEVHNCDFDYMTEQKNKLTKDNPLIIPEKIKNRI